MTEHYEEEQPPVESNANPARLSMIGGAVGALVGSRRGTAAALAGGVLGGTLGYLAGKASALPGTGGRIESADEPVVVTVGDGDEAGDAGAASDANDVDADESE